MPKQEEKTRVTPRGAAHIIAMQAIHEALADPGQFTPDGVTYGDRNKKEVLHYLAHIHDVIGARANLQFVPMLNQYRKS